MTKLKRFSPFSYHFAIFLLFAVCIIPASVFARAPGALIIDHNCTDITQIPEPTINQAKSALHIAYGHTSHGSQLTDGMTGLVFFANGGGLSLSLPSGIFAWNDGGSGGALDLHDYAMSGDAGYYPSWVNNTRSYLGTPDPGTGRGTNHADVNVIIWSWCGQVDDKYNAGTLHSEYLTPMSQLETDYPGVSFVYMTGHVNHSKHASTTAGNQVIREYCINNNKILYDFADIESYDPDGTYYEFPDDNCDYYASVTGSQLGNWATEWQNSHTENVDWYNCSSAHSLPLNANQKAYAAWWLWASLAGWDQSSAVQINYFQGRPSGSSVKLTWELTSDEIIRGFKIYRGNAGGGLTSCINRRALAPPDAREYNDENVYGGGRYEYFLAVVREDGSELRSLSVTVETPAKSGILYQNTPNPFNPITKIEYLIPDRTRVVLRVYDVQGKEIKILVNGVKNEGLHTVYWDGKNSGGLRVSSGLYFYRLESDSFHQTRKMIMLR